MKKIILLPMMAIVLLASSCKKEGCTDESAVNYNSKAKKDDGSCTYSGEVVLWWNQNTSSEMQIFGSTVVKLYIDGQFVDSKSASTYWTSAPDCGTNATMTVTKDLGKDKAKSFSFEIQDQDTDVLWTGTLSFDANTCTTQELVW